MKSSSRVRTMLGLLLARASPAASSASSRSLLNGSLSVGMPLTRLRSAASASAALFTCACGSWPNGVPQVTVKLPTAIVVDDVGPQLPALAGALPPWAALWTLRLIHPLRDGLAVSVPWYWTRTRQPPIVGFRLKVVRP